MTKTDKEEIEAAKIATERLLRLLKERDETITSLESQLSNRKRERLKPVLFLVLVFFSLFVSTVVSGYVWDNAETYEYKTPLDSAYTCNGVDTQIAQNETTVICSAPSGSAAGFVTFLVVSGIVGAVASAIMVGVSALRNSMRD